MKIAFLLDWEPPISQIDGYADGIIAALGELQKRGHQLQFFTVGRDMEVPHPLVGSVIFTSDPVRSIAEYNPEVILHHADTTRPNAEPLFRMLGKPMALCFAGGNPLAGTEVYFDHIFVESQVYKDTYNKAGYDNVSIAFGTNTDLFRPIEQTKAFDTIFPGTFALWKRHDLYAAATRGLRSLAVGYMYEDHEQECWQVCLDNGITVLPHVTAPALHRLYAAAKVVVIPSESYGGSQRTVLEAMAMNMPLVVCDSDKFDYSVGYARVADRTPEDIRAKIELALQDTQRDNGRDYVVKNWSHITYADELERGLEEIL